MPDENGSSRIELGYISPYFIVDDVVKTAEYYRDTLGFVVDGPEDDPPSFAMVRRDDVQIMLKSVGSSGLARPNRAAHPHASWDAYIDVSGLDALHEELRSRGADIVRTPEVTSYRTREFEVRDCNGYVLCFGTAARG